MRQHLSGVSSASAADMREFDDRRTRPAQVARPWWPWPAAVAAAFTLAQLLLVPPAMGLGWDEVIYVSQVSSHAPATAFSAPRARGVSVLVWPVTVWTSSTAALRVYLAVVSGLALFLVMRVWRGRRPPGVLAFAGLLFWGLWITVFYGPQAMPNLWVALAGLGAVGCFLRAAADRTDRAALWGLAACAAVMALMRPTDAVWLAVPLAAAPLLVRRWRRPALFAAVVLGLAAGGAQWVVEAYTSHGGLIARLERGSEIQGGLGWNIAVGDQLRTLAGLSICRPCDAPWPNPALAVWWFALPVLAGGGVALAVRSRRSHDTLLLTACAVTSGVPYLFFIDYAAPRFLLPTYALLAIPVADCLAWLAVGAARRRLRPVTASLVALAVAGHLAVQYVVVARLAARTDAQHRDWAHIADGLHALGIKPPCLVSGPTTVPIAYYAKCLSIATHGPNVNISVAGIRAAAQHQNIAVLVPPAGRPPGYAAAWPWRPLPAPPALAGYRVYTPPKTTVSSGSAIG
ncbi:hypothetical protein [Streptomyces sp. TRM68367]|uniref:hypothetical protein n=1 Tax=Streptomyces sp. TRM68367 TaxID=2758415 RepID=UPI00165A2141|nr:hypothetical protein [Streptomyces sp. TRM68367]MBC9729503.1 hypothetical protein [Streptomyces sp. TRM68367]